MTIEIYPEDEEIIKSKLARGDFSNPAEMIHRALACLPPTEPSQTQPPFLNRDRLKATPAERAAAFRRWAENHEPGIVLPEEAMHRASFYGDRG